MITGIDLVKEQLQIAQGEPLSFRQEDLEIKGHSIEVRVYAEDARNNFLPDIGTLHIYNRPQGNGIRVDDGFEEGMQIPIYYDPMIAKLIVHGENRAAAIRKMVRAIDEYEVLGVQTTLDFGRYVMEHEAFRSGNFDTHFITKHFKAEDLDEEVSETEKQLAAIVASLAFEESGGKTVKTSEAHPFQVQSSWRLKRG
jgi:acetyl/propionyl-CoA carboxylase alpha subunit